jgi:preprotein translocase subunit Sec61beta
MPPKSKKSTGFQSAAGLIRYFDSEVDKGPVFKPVYVVGFIIALVAIIEIAKLLFPT